MRLTPTQRRIRFSLSFCLPVSGLTVSLLTVIVSLLTVIVSLLTVIVSLLTVIVSLLTVILLAACQGTIAQTWTEQSERLPPPVSIPWPPPPTATSRPTPVTSGRLRPGRGTIGTLSAGLSRSPEQSRSPDPEHSEGEGEGSAKGAVEELALRPISSRCDGFGVEGGTAGHPSTPLPLSVDPVAGHASRQPARVVRIVDGDTIEVELASQRYKLRYIGIDTPETYREVECFGHEATEKNRELVEGKTVYLEKDVSETDRYSRLLRYVYLSDGTFVNAELVRGGYAQVATYPPDVKHADLFLQLQRQARQTGQGLWSRCP